MKVSLHISSPHECGYFNDQKASTLFLDPNENIDVPLYSDLLNIGFRRSGKLVYRPHCQKCNLCIPLRVNTQDFRPSRSQKRITSKNSDVKYQLVTCGYNESHFSLYKKYLAVRHTNGGMEKHTKIDYFESMIASDVQTMLIEFKQSAKV